MIQQGVSTDTDPSREVTIGRIMDYIEARLEAIRAREEEEDEEEEKERAARGGPPAAVGPNTAAKPPAAKSSAPTAPTAPPRRDQVRDQHSLLVVYIGRQPSCPDQPPAPPTPYTPSNMEACRAYASPPPLSSPTPPVLPLRPVPAQATLQPLTRASVAKSRLSVNPKELPPAPVSFTFDGPTLTDVSVSALASQPNPEPHLFTFPAAASTPLKRRREVMTVDGAPNPDGTATGAGGGTSRRRTRSWRGDQAKHQHQHQQRVDSHASGEAMDVEEEGPQRKRIARR